MSSKSSPIFILASLVLGVVVAVTLVSYHSVNSISLEIIYLNSEFHPTPGNITFHCRVTISHSGLVDCVLREISLSLVVNGIDCGGVTIDSPWKTFSSKSITYTTIFGVEDTSTAIMLARASPHNAEIIMKAKARSIIYSTRIEKTIAETFQN